MAAASVLGSAQPSVPRRLATALLCTVGVLGCSSDSEDAAAGTGGNTGAPVDIGSIGAGGADAPAPIVRSANGECSIVPDESGCTGVGYEGESIPLDIYILFDQSGSMCICVDPPRDHNQCGDPSCNRMRIEAVRMAMETFLNDPASAGIGVGLGYFGQLPINNDKLCDEASYANPIAPFGTLPGHAEALLQPLRSFTPTGETPTGPALRSSCRYAQQWKRDRVGHKVVMLLITDGEPKAPVSCPNPQIQCCPTLEDAAEAAADCLATGPGIETYVLGVGPFLDNLEQIAKAGGTDKAYLVSEGDVSAKVLEALNAIRADAAIPCELGIPPAPPGESLDLGKINVVHADPSCNGNTFYYVESSGSCTEQGGWHYDDPNDPTSIELCPKSCDLVSIPGSELLLSVGCKTSTLIR